MTLTQEQKQQFFDQGYLHLPGIIPTETLNTALRAINGYLGREGMDPKDLNRYRAQSYCPGLGKESYITDLFNATPVKEAAESAIGVGKIKPVGGGQIALRFPSLDPPREPGPHIDGMYSPTNGVKEGTIGNFTALAGIFLSDVPAPYSGNFTVWPGTHHQYEQFFREHGPEALLQGMPPIVMPEPVQITAKAGDAVLAHYCLAHGVAGNGAPHTRYAIFFRLHHSEHDQLHWESMTDIWREWEGMHALAGRD